MLGYSVYVRFMPCVCCVFFFLMIRRPPRSTLDRSSAASDVYKRQAMSRDPAISMMISFSLQRAMTIATAIANGRATIFPVSYAHLRAHETVLDLVCRLLLEKNTTPHNYKDVQLHTRANE